MSRSVRRDHDALLLGAGFDFLLTRGQGWNMSISTGYDAALREDGLDQDIFTGLSVEF